MTVSLQGHNPVASHWHTPNLKENSRHHKILTKKLSKRKYSKSSEMQIFYALINQGLQVIV